MARTKPYITAAELRAVVPDQHRDAALADTLGGAKADPGLLTSILQTASNEVDALIEGRIRLPLESVPQKVKTAALYIALEVLYLRRGLDLPEFQAKKVTFWRDWLSKVGAGELRLEADASAGAANPKKGGAISVRRVITGHGIIGSILLTFCFSFLPSLGNATPPRSFEFPAPDYPTIEIADYMEWFQGESVELVYTDIRPDGREVRWEVSETSNLWMNLPPVGQTSKAWTFFATPTNTVLPAGRYNGRVAVYERIGTNLVFHRIVAQQEIVVHPARDPDLLILASPLAQIFDPAILVEIQQQAADAQATADKAWAAITEGGLGYAITTPDGAAWQMQAVYLAPGIVSHAWQPLTNSAPIHPFTVTLDDGRTFEMQGVYLENGEVTHTWKELDP